MKKYISLGGGVDSTALMLWLLDHNEVFEAVFVDHGADYPETYKYIKYLQDKGYPITIIKPEMSLIEYCETNNVFPMRQWKWCTDKFKLRPMKAYFQIPCICYIGIGKYEKRRIKTFKSIKSGIYNAFPLAHIDKSREDWQDYIAQKGLKVPPKSGCFICPMAKIKELKEMREHYPELHNIRCKLLDNANEAILIKKGQTKLKDND